MKTTAMTNKRPEGDAVIYMVHALPGGCDGMDHTNRGGPVKAFETLEAAKKYVGHDTRYEIKPSLVKWEGIGKVLKNKLTPAEKLYLKLRGVDLEKSGLEK